MRLCGSASRQQNLSLQALHPFEILANHGVVRPQLYCGLETDNGFVEPSLQREQLSHEMVGVRICWAQREGALGLDERLLQLTRVEQRRRQVVAGGRVAFVEAERMAELNDRLVELLRSRARSTPWLL